MRVTVDIVENGFVATPHQAGPQGRRERTFVAKNVLDLAEVFEGLRREDELLTGRGDPGEPVGILNFPLVRGDQVPAPSSERSSSSEGPAEDPDWPSTVPGSDIPTSTDVEGPEPAVAEDEVTYTPATEDGYEFPQVRGPKNGRREIQCPDHGWQLAVVRDGAYRCQFKPSPKTTCTLPGTPRQLADKRLAAGS